MNSLRALALVAAAICVSTSLLGQYNSSINSPVSWNASPSARIPESTLASVFNTRTTNGLGADISILSNNWAIGGGYGLMNGDNLVSPVVWMYSGGQSAFTVAKMNFASDPSNVMGNYLIPLLQVRNNGNVGIGTTSPQDMLHIANGGNIRLQQTGNSIGLTSDISFNTYRDTEPTQIGCRIRFNTVENTASGYPSVMKTGEIHFRTKWGWDEQTRLMISANGNIGIGTTTPDAQLAVKGQVHAQEVKVELNVGGPDYVFEKDYKLASLEDIKNYIDQNKHLPEVPSAKEMEKNGVQLGEMNMLLLKKIEELTLYVIELKGEVKDLREHNNQKK